MYTFQITKIKKIAEEERTRIENRFGPAKEKSSRKEEEKIISCFVVTFLGVEVLLVCITKRRKERKIADD